MRQTNIEESIVKSGVDEAEQKDEPPVGAMSDLKVLMGGKCHGKYQQSGDGEPYTGKEHLAACHRRCYLKFGIAQLDERIGKSPGDGSREGKQCYPQRTLENG